MFDKLIDIITNDDIAGNIRCVTNNADNNAENIENNRTKNDTASSNTELSNETS